MTAVRWWVKAYARWIARLKAVQGQLGLFFNGMSGISLASGALRYFGAPNWVIGLFLALLAIFLVGYTFLYSEGGVWNQSQRDQADLSNNYADPNARINAEMSNRTLLAALLGRPLTDEEIEAIRAELNRAFLELRDGVDIDESE